MKALILITLFISLQRPVFALGVGLGGYVPFGLSSQNDSEGGTGTLSLQPTIYVNSIVGSYMGHMIMPEIGYVHYTGLSDDYSKKSMYFLADVGYKLGANFILKYGFGFFRTSIGGDGETINLNNGSSTQDFYQPSESVTTYSSTLNFGAEFAATSKVAFRFESFLHGYLSSTKRDLSYMFSLTYYL